MAITILRNDWYSHFGKNDRQLIKLSKLNKYTQWELAILVYEHITAALGDVYLVGFCLSDEQVMTTFKKTISAINHLYNVWCRIALNYFSDWWTSLRSH